MEQNYTINEILSAVKELQNLKKKKDKTIKKNLIRKIICPFQKYIKTNRRSRTKQKLNVLFKKYCWKRFYC